MRSGESRLYKSSGNKSQKEKIDLAARLGTSVDNLNAKNLTPIFLQHFSGKANPNTHTVYDGLEYVNSIKHGIERGDLLNKLAAAGYIPNRPTKKETNPLQQFAEAFIEGVEKLFSGIDASPPETVPVKKEPIKKEEPVKKEPIKKEELAKKEPIKKEELARQPTRPMTLLKGLLNITKRVYSGDYSKPAADTDDGRAGKLCEIFAELYDPGNHENIDFADGELKTYSASIDNGIIRAKGRLCIMSDVNFRSNIDSSRTRLFGRENVGKILNILCVCVIHLYKGDLRAAVYAEPIHVDNVPVDALKEDFDNIVAGKRTTYLVYCRDAFYLKPKFIEEFVISRFSNYDAKNVPKRNGANFITEISSSIQGLPPRQLDVYNQLLEQGFKERGEDTTEE